MGSFQRFGQVLKGGGARQPTEVDRGRGGPASGNNAIPTPPFRYGVQPIPRRMALQLFVATNLTSPMVAGRFRAQLPGKGQNMANTTDLGPLQSLRGMYQGPQNARLNAQAGPSSQPAFPSTNNDVTVLGLGAMDLPNVWRV